VVFVDIGQSDYSVSVVAFQKGRMAVKSVAFDRHLGGRDFDQVLVDHFVEEFKGKYKMDISQNAKALFRLRMACERVKKILSANLQAPISVECLMNDKDVSGMVERCVDRADPECTPPIFFLGTSLRK
jgi:heat shock protein 4